MNLRYDNGPHVRLIGSLAVKVHGLLNLLASGHGHLSRCDGIRNRGCCGSTAG